ncbi:MAG: transglutaminase family protein [Zestosphaera sp.]
MVVVKVSCYARGKARVSVTVALLAFLTVFTASAAGATSGEAKYERLDFMYIDVAEITYALGVSEGYFEAPINYSDPHYMQVVRVVEVGGDAVVERLGNETVFKLPISDGVKGYVVLNVTVTYDASKELGVVAQALYLKDVTLYNNPYPEDVTSRYILPPNVRVVEVVVPSFEEWLGRELPPNYNVSRVSKTYLAVWAAYYVYGGYLIRYNASSIPRVLEEVLETREGDCDDMSRVLLSLLWHYGVPAKIQYGYVYLRGFDYESEVYGSLTRFINTGPHAYVVIYVPDVGWVSVDFLAYARLIHPTLVTGESTYTNVSKEDISAIEEEHAAFKYLELIEVHEVGRLPGELVRALEEGALVKRLEKLLSPIQPINETTTPAGTPTSSLATSVTTSTSIPTHTVASAPEESVTTDTLLNTEELVTISLLVLVVLIITLAVLARKVSTPKPT